MFQLSNNPTTVNKPTLLDQARHLLRTKHYSKRKKKLLFNGLEDIFCSIASITKKMSEKEIKQFLTHPAVKENVSASTENQAY